MCGGLTAEELRGTKPNIIFIMADDLGWGDVGFNGSNYFETPNLDKLATGSMNFKQAYMYDLFAIAYCFNDRQAFLQDSSVYSASSGKK